MKVGIVGYINNSKSLMASAIIEVLKNKGVEVVTIDEKECFYHGIHISKVFIDEAKSITPQMLELPFTPPLTRKERRKLKRKNK